MKPLLRYHLFIACAIAIWLVLFLVLIAPFDISEISFSARLQIMPVYGVISFLGYIMLVPLHEKLQQWVPNHTILLEVVFMLLFNILVWIGSFFYYQSSIVNGEYSLVEFTLSIYYPVFLVLLPILLFARWFIKRKALRFNSEEIILTGENKLDILRIKNSDLVSVSSADNYVEVSYLINKVLSKKLLRTTLKNIETQHPQLLRVHRSHLIHPIHFIEWKSPNVILLTQMEIAVSKNYKKSILELNHSSLKQANSSQPQ